jgi:hypothetical protein
MQARQTNSIKSELDQDERVSINLMGFRSKLYGQGRATQVKGDRSGAQQISRWVTPKASDSVG